MKQLRNIVAGMLVLIGGMLPATTFAQEPVPGDTTATLQQEIIVGKDTINQEANQVDVKGIVFGHIGDSYEWHITNIGKTSICRHSLLGAKTEKHANQKFRYTR
mgnify:CR=1 FL=1